MPPRATASRVGYGKFSASWLVDFNGTHQSAAIAWSGDRKGRATPASMAMARPRPIDEKDAERSKSRRPG